VTTDQLLDAYKAQALSAEQQNGVSYKKLRIPVWRKANNVVLSAESQRIVDDLDCPAMRTGVHKWSILVENLGRENRLVLGVEVPRDQYARTAWSYCEAGDVYSYMNGRQSPVVTRDLATFGSGSKVTFILDLTGAGTLAASVDDAPFVQLFSDMLSHLPDGAGLHPVVNMQRPGRIRFLGFE
jgi:hypothetical protein